MPVDSTVQESEILFFQARSEDGGASVLAQADDGSAIVVLRTDSEICARDVADSLQALLQSFEKCATQSDLLQICSEVRDVARRADIRSAVTLNLIQATPSAGGH